VGAARRALHGLFRNFQAQEITARSPAPKSNDVDRFNAAQQAVAEWKQSVTLSCGG